MTGSRARNWSYAKYSIEQHHRLSGKVTLAVGSAPSWAAKSENHEDAYRRSHATYVRSVHGVIYESLTGAVATSGGHCIPTHRADEARKLTDLDAAHRLLQHRGLDLFVELSAKGWTMTALRWTDIKLVPVQENETHWLVLEGYEKSTADLGRPGASRSPTHSSNGVTSQTRTVLSDATETSQRPSGLNSMSRTSLS